MADTERTKETLLAMFADNAVGKISAQDMRDLIVSTYIVQGALTVATKTDDYVLSTSDFGKSLRMNSAGDKSFTFPSLGSSEDGARVTFIKQGSGKLTIIAVDSDIIHEGSAAGSIYSITDYAMAMLEYVHAMNRLVFISAYGSWTTT